jgi:hypothetical protein
MHLVLYKQKVKAARAEFTRNGNMTANVKYRITAIENAMQNTQRGNLSLDE